MSPEISTYSESYVAVKAHLLQAAGSLLVNLETATYYTSSDYTGVLCIAGGRQPSLYRNM